MDISQNFTIRPTVTTDLPGIAVIADATQLFPSEMLGEMTSSYLAGTSIDIWLTAEGPRGPIGFAFCEPERLTNGTWNLLAIAVMPEQQGRRVGAKLVRQLEIVLRERAQRILLVETLGTPDFARTRDFYLANGFDEEARIREFYDVGGDKVVFWKRL